MSFGSPAPRSVPTTTIQQNTLPEWVKREGEKLFVDRALPEAERPFPAFPVDERIEPFGSDTSAAFNLARRETGTSIPGTGPATTAATANPEWTRIKALLDSAGPTITSGGDTWTDTPQSEMLQLKDRFRTLGAGEHDIPGFGTYNVAFSNGSFAGADKLKSRVPLGTTPNPEFEQFQSQLSGINPTIPGQPIPGTGTPGQPGGPPAWAEAFNNAMAGTAAGAVPVGASDIERFFNPFTEQVIDPVVNQINRQFTRETSQRHGDLARRGSYLNEDRRGAMDILAGEAKDRTISETTARLRMGAFGDALQQGNVERDRTMTGGAQFGQLAPERQQLGIRDIATLTGVGGMQEAKGQENRTLNFEEFMREFSFPQNQTGFLTSVLSGIPFETGRTTQGQTLIAQANPFTQALGLGISAASLFASHRAFKENATPVSPNMVLEAFANLPVEKWRYKPGMRLGQQPHIGPYAEDFKKMFGVGDGVTIDPIDAIGVLCAAVKALTARIKELEDG